MTREQIHIGDMSHEKAIGILKLMLEAMEAYDGISPTPKRVNAMKMAIESLEQEPILDKIRSEVTALKSHHINDRYDDGFQGCRIEVIDILDKYKSESEGDNE